MAVGPNQIFHCSQENGEGRLETLAEVRIHYALSSRDEASLVRCRDPRPAIPRQPDPASVTSLPAGDFRPQHLSRLPPPNLVQPIRPQPPCPFDMEGDSSGSSEVSSPEFASSEPDEDGEPSSATSASAPKPIPRMSPSQTSFRPYVRSASDGLSSSPPAQSLYVPFSSVRPSTSDGSLSKSLPSSS
jgi:hypothetical protein